MARLLKFFKTGNRLHGQVMDWCQRLHDIEVQSLDLYRTRRHKGLGLSVIVTLLDDSKYCLKRRIDSIRGPEFVPGFVDTIEQLRTPLPAELDPQALIHMQFRPERRPNLTFILIICYGIQSHHGLFRASEIIADSDFFALALVLNVARKCIYRRDITRAPASTQSPLNLLWQEVYQSIQNESYTFWGDAVAEQTKNITREFVYKAARKKITTLLTCEESTAASIVARVEVLAKRKDLLHPTLWDEAWDKHWKGVWSNRQLQPHPGTSTRTTSKSALLSNSNVPAIEVDGRTPGGKAGRTLSMIPVAKDNRILFDVLTNSLRSLPRAECSPIANKDGTNEFINESTELATNTASQGKGSEPRMWPGYCIPVVHDQAGFIWASPREMAVEVAWEEGWNIAAIQGKRAAENIQKINKTNGEPTSTNLQNNPQNISSTSKKLVSRFIRHAKKRAKIGHLKNHLSIEPPKPTPNQTQVTPLPSVSHDIVAPPNSTTLGLHSPDVAIINNQETVHTLADLLGLPIGLDSEDKHAFQLSIQERRYLEMKELARIQAKEATQLILSERGTGHKLPNNGSENAWKLTNPGAYTNPTLKELSNQVARRLRAQSDTGNSQGNQESDIELEFTRKEFLETWERAWKESWDAAWETVWEATWNAAVSRGVEFGAESIFDKEPDLVRDTYNEIQNTESYRAMKISLDKETALATLEELRIMMKELYHLYELLHHSVSDCRDGSIEITVTKTKRFTHTNGTGNAAKRVTCFELQTWIEDNFINSKFHVDFQAHTRKVFKRGIADVWRLISLIEEK